MKVDKFDFTIVGGGFTGLVIAYELQKRGINTIVLEAENEIGGLAGAFNINNTKLDKFYHHWFTNDVVIKDLISELNLSHLLELNATNTGIYFNSGFFKLSTPLDLLKFSPLNIIDRIRLGILTLRARSIKNWEELESLTAKEWLIKLGGENVYKVVWEPLLKGKFGIYSEQISAVWFWNKLKLRGGSRGKNGEEQLVYFKGSFSVLGEKLKDRIEELGGIVSTNSKVVKILKNETSWVTILENEKEIKSQNVVNTLAFPLIANMVKDWFKPALLNKLNSIKYIGNICLILELEKSLSKTYWLNVNEKDFPFVGVIEHTNFEKPETYGGSHIIYLSKYLPTDDILYKMSKDEFLEYSIKYLKKMFKDFDESLIKNSFLWKAEYSQPVVENFYSKKLINENELEEGFFICTMAQIYPEDRGTNYAIREGQKFAQKIISQMNI